MGKANVDEVRFEPLTEQPAEVIERIRQLRNAEGVRRYMYNDHLISAEEHAGWIAGLQGNARERVMVVRYHGEVVGLVALRAIRWPDKAADWAFYLSEEMQGKGVGGVVEFKLLDLALIELGLEKLNCEVLETNPKVIEMHQKFGFVAEGVRRANVVKDGGRLDVHLLGITAGEWQAARPRFAKLFGAG
ncbi:UDP-4-amino-4,6-dideoxy-N-acetyl-beta-L-altrosamine N-acetyltransferase [Chitinimonas koreensis]|uniref:UDP-4-amino-4, 6-dideoxy-N-acetyl-beta-L-altrosamine N-acetyltransferase n=1 Tax=Chitinimonas koreensis TaxID=356302 RepID=UPI0003F7EC5C|nr:UDP-4-amino-4,6-dideoxy-N-acetyl-beta-L-altrosamine N-acetyltransferase [Chitinimonas koreensis]QNM98494.1 UDP-4-amino-4,6-dideoxy-N-acetyl-beta-L-altrosamine N-acetyltransferase [Chitinimonas koreensis]